jgi:hypothetical protein
MSVIIVRGYKVKHGYKEEVTEGTMPDGSAGNPITYDYLGFLTGLTPTVNPNPIPIHPIGTRYPVQYIKGQRDIALSLETHVHTKTPLLYATSNINKTITFWEKIEDLNSSLMYLGARCNRLRLRGEVGAPLTVTFDFLCKNISTTPPSYANLPDPPASTPFHFPDQGVTVGGSAPTGKVNAFEAEINNNLERIYVLGDVVSATSVEKTIEVTGSITMTFSSINDLNDVLNLTGKSNLVMKLGKEGSNDVTLTISNFVWTAFPKPVRVGDVLRITLPFSSYGAVPTIA